MVAASRCLAESADKVTAFCCLCLMKLKEERSSEYHLRRASLQAITGYFRGRSDAKLTGNCSKLWVEIEDMQ